MANNAGGALDINDPFNIVKYYKKVYRNKVGHDKGYKKNGCEEGTISYAEQEEDMKLMDEKYKIIEDEVRLTVIVPSENDTKDIYRQLLQTFEENKYEMRKEDMISAHDISVSVMGSEKNLAKIAACCKPLLCKGEPTGWYIGGKDIYISETGLKMFD